MKRYIFLSVFIFSLGFSLELDDSKLSGNTNVVSSSGKANSREQITFENYDEVELQSFDSNYVRHIKFMGNVRVRFQGKYLKSRILIVSLLSNKVTEISAFDNVEFKSEDSIYLCERMFFDPEKKHGVLYDVRSFLKDVVRGAGPITTTRGLFFEAEKATILSEKRMILENVYFTFTDIEPPPYRMFSRKLWYFKDEIIFALFDAYYVGQSIFLPLPFYFRWEKFTGVRTSFGEEKRIGWYLMNTVDFNFNYGNTTVYLDFYEKLGQYIMVNFRNTKPISAFNTLVVNFHGANDQRVMYDAVNDRYSQNVRLEDGTITNISYLSWNYNISGTISKDNMSFGFYWEDLNDPLFKHKFTTRRESFDVRQILQPLDNSFYGARRGSLDITAQTYNRSFSINFYTFSMSGRWSYRALENPEYDKYMAERYKYYLYTSSLPVVSFSTPTFELLNTEYSIPVRTIRTSPTSAFQKSGVSQDTINTSTPVESVNSNVVSKVNNKTSENNAVSNAEDSISTSGSTNIVNEKTNSQTIEAATVSNSRKTTSTTNIIDETGKFSFYSIRIYASGNFNYNSLENFETNGYIGSDMYSHKETGRIGEEGGLLGDLIKHSSSLNFENTKQWATDPVASSNYFKSSGYSLDLSSTISSSIEPKIFKEEWYQFSFPLSISHSLTYEIIKTTAQRPLNMTHTTSLNFGLGILQNQLKNTYSLSHYIQYRLTNEEVNDIYINNVLERTLSLETGLSFFYVYNNYWLSLNTSTKLNILDTKTNDETTRVNWHYPEITNRITPGSSPKLSLSFTPASVFNPLPKITYVYDILKNTNESFRIDSTYSINNIYNFIFYRIEVLNLSSYLYWDYLNPKKDEFSLTFSTAVWFNTDWRLTFSTAVVNRNIYKYLKDYNPPDKDYIQVDFWDNFLDGLKIYDYDALKRSYFKVQQLNFVLTHYILEEWELNISFSITRKTDENRLIAYWEPSILITFMLRGTSEQFPPYQKTFLPEDYQ
ncbi:MAG: hypothetical protein ACP5QT_07225 [Brevinematia bacterium]